MMLRSSLCITIAALVLGALTPMAAAHTTRNNHAWMNHRHSSSHGAMSHRHGSHHHWTRHLKTPMRSGDAETQRLNEQELARVQAQLNTGARAGMASGAAINNENAATYSMPSHKHNPDKHRKQPQ